MNKKKYETPTVCSIPLATCFMICDSPIKTGVADDDDTPPGGWGPGNAKERQTDDEQWEYDWQQ